MAARQIDVASAAADCFDAISLPCMLQRLIASSKLNEARYASLTRMQVWRSISNRMEGPGRACQVQIAVVGMQPDSRQASARWLARAIRSCSIAEFGDAADPGLRPPAGDFDLAVLVIDLASRLRSVDAIGQLAASLSHIPVLALSDHADTNLLMEAIQRGARGYMLTTMRTAVVKMAIDLVLKGGVFVPAKLLIAPFAAGGKQAVKRKPSGHTQRPRAEKK